MRKAVSAILIGLVALALVAGCSVKTDVPDNSPPPSTITTNQIPFTVVSDLSTLPDEIQKAIHQVKLARGFATFKESDDTSEMIIVISAGQMPTGGYSISVKHFEDIEGTPKIVVEETAPGKDDIVTMMISYPVTVIKTNKLTDKTRLVVADAESKSLPTVMSSKGIYQGQADTTSIEIKVASAAGDYDTYATFQTTEFTLGQINTGMDGKPIKTGDEVTFRYFTNDKGQNVIVFIDGTLR